MIAPQKNRIRSSRCALFRRGQRRSALDVVIWLSGHASSMSAARIRRGISSGAAAQIVVAVADIGVEMPGDQSGDGLHVLVPAVAGQVFTRRCACPRGFSVHQIDHGADGGLVMAIIENDAEAVLVEDVHPAGDWKKVLSKVRRPVADLVQRLAKRKGPWRREHGIFDVVQRLALQRRRDQVRPDQRDVRAVLVDDDLVAVDALFQHHGALAKADMLAHQLMLGVAGDV